jgi:ABC-2 type transport system ATP-binding protein
MPPLNVQELTKSYGEVLAADAVSFTVEAGEVFGFLGPNGAGKTTVIRTLLGFLKPTSGTATVLGADIRDEDALVEARQRLGYLPDTLGFDEGVTGKRVLDYHASIKGESRREELETLFTPPLSRPVREYSSGNRRMLGIIQAFMHDPDLVIMDEPTAGLDPLKQEQFNEFVRAESERGTTLFFSSHVLSEVRRVCDRVGILRDGRLIELEEIQTLLDQGGKRVLVQTTPQARAELEALDGVVDVTAHGDGIQFIYAGEYDALLDALARHDIRDIEISEPPLEDVFMHYYGTAGTDRGENSEAGTDA